MAIYEYVCLGCEHRFEQRRSIDAAVDVALTCPSCESDRVSRRFSVFATGASTTSSPSDLGGQAAPSAGAACCGGGGCACGR